MKLKVVTFCLRSGGGPFGNGRTVSIAELEHHLMQSLKVLREDSLLANSLANC
jgi:hypothetical protein